MLKVTKITTEGEMTYRIAGNIDVKFNLTVRPTVKLISINMNFPNTISPGIISLRQIKICQKLLYG